MFKKAKFLLEYKVGESLCKIETSSFADAENADVKVKFSDEGGIYEVTVVPSKKFSIERASISFGYDFPSGATFFGNGHQSWTDTREYRKGDKMRDLGLVGKVSSHFGPIFKNAGDYHYASYKNRRSCYHSISYTYVRNGGSFELLGSLNERLGYTVFYGDMRNNQIRIEKDVEGVTFEKETVLFSIYYVKGGYDAVMDAYFGAMGAKLRATEVLKGYTSWYNYYSNISEEIILRDLNALHAAAPEINTFQIDDGYQTAVGDWLSVDAKKFPNGMKVIADAIHDKGYKAGIWVNPLGAQLDSKILAEHPEWMIPGTDGKPKTMGPNWGGFTGLNFYLPEVRAHIKHFFDVILNEWGFDLVKLDFLYAASVVPMYGKSRAETMFDAMEFIRECVGDKEILGCGVPIIPCVNLVEYMRIGADMGLSWSQGIYGMTTHREDVNTRNAIHNALNRRHLNNRVFLNDPDVFLLRDYSIGLSWEHRKLLATIIKLTGGVLFTSDDVGRYSKEQTEFMHWMLDGEKLEITDVVLKSNIYTVKYTEKGEAKQLRFSLKTGKILA